MTNFNVLKVKCLIVHCFTCNKIWFLSLRFFINRSSKKVQMGIITTKECDLKKGEQRIQSHTPVISKDEAILSYLTRANPNSL